MLQKYYFTIGDQVIEVDADLLCNALSITSKHDDHPFVPLTLEKEIISFVNKFGCIKPIKIISTLRVNELHQPWRTFMEWSQATTLTLLFSFGKNSNIKLRPEGTNDKIPKRPLSFQHVIKLDTTLGNLKFASKGIIDPVFGMPIAAVMLNDNIKASAEYLEYFKKSV
ncbi:hypothetical protein Tco_0122194 [Tanacetum coccineum]